MKRRKFIGTLGVLGACAISPIPAYSMPMPKKSKYKMGLQLFTVNGEMNTDAIGTLKAVKAMGYQDFEIYGFDETKDTFYGHKSSDFRNILDDLQLTVSSGHFGFSPYFDKSDDVMKGFVDQCISGAHALGMNYIAWPWLSPDQRSIEHFKLLSEKLNVIGEQVTSAGLKFAYHHHDFEFIDHNGENGFEIILNETDPNLVKMEMDMYWVIRASNYTPKELVSKHPGRYTIWHLKDMDKVSKDYTELGNGSIDYTSILPDPTESGLEFYYLEQGGNFAHSPMQSVADSAEYFKKHIQVYLS